MIALEKLGLESWRHALKKHGIKDYKLNFSSSEDEQEKAERKQKSKASFANAVQSKFGLKVPANQDTKDVTPRDGHNTLSFLNLGVNNRQPTSPDQSVAQNTSENSFVKTTKVDLNASDQNIDQIEKKFNEIVDPNRDNPLDILNTFGRDDKIDIQDQKEEQD